MIRFYRKFLSVFFLFIFIFSNENFLINNLNCFAEEDDEDLIAVDFKNKTEEPLVSARAAVLIDSSNDSIIYKKNEKKEMAMASTTKIMTTLLALESAEKDDKEIEITKEMINVEGSSMYLKAGNKLRLTDLAKGMITVSGNDAANATAIALAGSCEEFAKIMNEKARLIGMKNTFFVTPSGLDEDGHHSTAYDMAVLGSYAVKNDLFREIVSKKKWTISFIKPKKTITFKNKNKLLKLFKWCIGGKTGFTQIAKRCLVSFAEMNGIVLVAVTLNAGDDWNDHIKLFNYGFSKLSSVEGRKIESINVPVVGSNISSIEVVQKKAPTISVEIGEKPSLTTRINVPKFIYAPIKEGEKVGSVEYFNKGKFVSSMSLFANESAEFCETSQSNIFSLDFWKNLLFKKT
ncbi:MAG: D-alanyl-D-alanine carboxypeptidase [Oscillospiraceae bacterium]|nr:D-alanyl-D-alanine carboxypeptidase [Oscillospiraceae bacterium]